MRYDPSEARSELMSLIGTMAGERFAIEQEIANLEAKASEAMAKSNAGVDPGSFNIDETNKRLQDLYTQLRKLDEKMANLESAEKLSNLAKNTVSRLNTMEQRINEFNLENRKRLSRLDNQVEKIGTKMDDVSQSLSAILPALLKLTQKV